MMVLWSLWFSQHPAVCKRNSTMLASTHGLCVCALFTDRPGRQVESVASQEPTRLRKIENE